MGKQVPRYNDQREKKPLSLIGWKLKGHPVHTILTYLFLFRTNFITLYHTQPRTYTYPFSPRQHSSSPIPPEIHVYRSSLLSKSTGGNGHKCQNVSRINPLQSEALLKPCSIPTGNFNYVEVITPSDFGYVEVTLRCNWQSKKNWRECDGLQLPPKVHDLSVRRLLALRKRKLKVFARLNHFGSNWRSASFRN